MQAGQAKDAEDGQATNTQIRWLKPRTTLTNSWSKAWNRLAGLGLSRWRQGFNLRSEEADPAGTAHFWFLVLYFLMFFSIKRFNKIFQHFCFYSYASRIYLGIQSPIWFAKMERFGHISNSNKYSVAEKRKNTIILNVGSNKSLIRWHICNFMGAPPYNCNFWLKLGHKIC